MRQSEFRPHRKKQKAIRRAQAIQEGQRGEDTLWSESESANRHERRRFRKAERKYDKLHGEGAAQEHIKQAADDPFVARFIRCGD